MRSDFDLPKPTIKTLEARRIALGFSPLQKRFVRGQRKLCGTQWTGYRQRQIVQYIDVATRLANNPTLSYETFWTLGEKP